MKTLRVLWRRGLGLIGKGLPPEDIEAELLSHVELHYDDNIRAGMSPAEAKRNALIRLGGHDRTRQRYRERATIPLIEAVVRDLSFALRQLRRSPGFTFTALAVFALSLSGGIAIAAFVDSVLVKPLPYDRPDRLVALFERVPAGDRYHLSFDDYVEWKKTNHQFSGLEVYRPVRVVLKESSGPHPVTSAMVSAGFFSALGVAPTLGRGFDPNDDYASGERKALLSHATWEQRFRSDPNIVGRSLQLDGELYTISGVLPQDFHFAPVQTAEIWQTAHGYCADNRNCHPYYGVARLKDGSSLKQASDELNSIAGRIAESYPLSNRDRSASALPLTDFILGGIRPVLLALLAGAALLFLIGLVNVFNLLLVRAENRLHETAIRSALGASRLRLFRQFACEGFLLAAGGSTLGLLLGFGFMRLCVSQFPRNILNSMPYLEHLHLSGHVFLLTGIMAVLGGLLFTAAPVFQLGDARIMGGLSNGGRSGVGKSWRRFGAGLVIAELLITVVLLVSAGLLTKSFYRFLNQELGFSPQHVSVLHVFSEADLSDKQSITLGRKVLARVAELPGIADVAISGTPVLNGAESYRMLFTPFKVAGRSYIGLGNEALNESVAPNYFETLHAQLIKGRYFSEADTLSKPRVAIVNEQMVRENFAGEDPVGKRIHSHYNSGQPIEIVGVVQDLKDGSLDAPPTPTVYSPFEQLPASDFYLTFRTSGEDEASLASIPTALHQMDPELIIDGGETLDRVMKSSESAYLHRMTAGIAGISAALALLLSAVGLYGLISYSVGHRTREIGIRMALGAQRSSVYRIVLKEGAWLAALGIAGGILSSLITTRFLRTMIFHVSPWDGQILLLVTIVLGSTALLASYFPARRAASINPNEAIRNE